MIPSQITATFQTGAAIPDGTQIIVVRNDNDRTTTTIAGTSFADAEAKLHAHLAGIDPTKYLAPTRTSPIVRVAAANPPVPIQGTPVGATPVPLQGTPVNAVPAPAP